MAKTTIFWNSENDQYLRENYGVIENKRISDKLGKSVSCIHNRARKLSLDKSFYMRKGLMCVKWTEEDTRILVKLHRKKTMSELGQILGGRSWHTIASRMRYLGLRKRMCNYEGKIWVRRTDTGSYQVRIFKDGKFRSYAQTLWNAHYGEVPRGKVVVTKDRNPLHCRDIGNLEIINQRLQLYRNNPRISDDEAIAHDLIAGIKDNLNIPRKH